MQRFSMPHITVAEQRAFVHGRDIRCNIILAESLLYRDPPVDGALLSLDWAKANDRVSYAYLSQVLSSYRFNRGLRNKIEATMHGFTCLWQLKSVLNQVSRVYGVSDKVAPVPRCFLKEKRV